MMLCAMSTSKATVERILAQLEQLPIRTRPMFGEYGIYFDDKIFGIIADDILFVKKTLVSDGLVGDSQDAPPYPGAKPYVRVTDDQLADATWLRTFVIETAGMLPAKK